MSSLKKTDLRLSVDRTSPVPLVQQVYDGLDRLIRSGKSGERIPTEIELIAVTGVSRITIRGAIQRLVNNGRLTRTRKGTYIADNHRPNAASIHPFALPSVHQRHIRVTTLRIALYENQMVQQRAWNRLVDLFNQKHPPVRLTIEWVPLDVVTPESYESYVRQYRPNIVLLSVYLAREFKRSGLLAPLDAGLSRMIHGDQYFSGIIGADHESLLSYAAPIHFAPWVLIWNENLVKHKMLNNLRYINQSKFIELMAEVGPRLPPHVSLLANAWNLPLTRGLPIHADSPQALSRYFRNAFAVFKQLRTLNPRLIWSKESRPTFIERFADGNTPFYAGNYAYVIDALCQLSFPWKGAFLIPEEDNILSIDWSCLGIPPVSSNIQQAMTVLRFFISETAQDEIAKTHLNCSFLRKSNRHLVAWLCKSHQQDLELPPHRMYLYHALDFDWGSFVHVDLQFLFEGVANGTMEVDQAAEIAVEKMSHIPLMQRSA